jgi:hypothetical protein
VLGEDFIKHAFKVASEVDPGAKLYYNDYNLESPGPKSEGARRIVKMLQDDGIKIDGVGMQAHLVAQSHPTLDEHVAVIQSYVELGVEVALTELDIRIEMPVNDTNMAWQKEAYKNVSNSPHILINVCSNLELGRLLELACRSRDAWESPSGTFMTPSAGFRLSSRARVQPCSGLRTSRPTRPTTVSLRR